MRDRSTRRHRLSLKSQLSSRASTDLHTYLDHNATTPVRPEAAEAVARALAQYGNASSVHRFGRLIRHVVDGAREDVAALVDTAPANIIFTSGGTEANNQALMGHDGPVLVSAVEHDSVREVRADATIIPVDANGITCGETLDRLLWDAGGGSLVSVMLANNETGVLQPIREIFAVARAHGAVVHCDAVQAAGKMAIAFDDLGADVLSLSAHKLGGPPGIGALVVRDGFDPELLLRGGGQERRRRAGTENVPGIAGFGAAACAAKAGIAKFGRLGALRDNMEARLRDAVSDIAIHGGDAPRLPNTSCLGLPSLASEIQVMQLDLAGIAVSAGSACSSGKVASSHVLRAMGCENETARSAIGVSLGWSTEPRDVVRFIDAWIAMAQRRDGKADKRRSVA